MHDGIITWVMSFNISGSWTLGGLEKSGKNSSGTYVRVLAMEKKDFSNLLVGVLWLLWFQRLWLGLVLCG